MINREDALKLFRSYNESDSLLKHALAVEAVMCRFARELGEDPSYWGIVGLLHDIDYGQWPEQHCKKAPDILSSHGFDDAFIHAVVSHGWSLCSDVEPVHGMEKVLFTIDELTGLIISTALMRPSRSLSDLQWSSVKKKWKTKGFSAGVNRELIERGAAMLGMTLERVVELSIEGMREVATELDLA